MTAEFTQEELLEICQGRQAAGMSRDESGSISTDTRNLKEGQWYLACVGEKFDGHDFLGDAFASGALGAVVEERTHYPISNPSFPLLAVDNTLVAYHALARNWRRRIRPKVVAVTGSSGKTTTKEMCAAVFAGSRRAFWSSKNENNEYGVPKTLLAMPDDTQVAVIEMAMRGAGQIDELARCAEPDIAIITNAGTAHIELLGSRENIAAAKCELLRHLKFEHGTAILGSQDTLLFETAKRNYAGKLLRFTEDSIEVVNSDPCGTTFKINGSEELFQVKAHGLPLLQDAWCAVQAGRAAGLSDSEIKAGLANFEIVTGRGNRLTSNNGALVLDESYNANPDSVKAAVLSMLDRNAYPHPEKYLVVGELAELGDHTSMLLSELGRWLKDKPLAALVTVGKLAAIIADGAQGAPYPLIRCQDASEAARELSPLISATSCVLVKGSRAARLEVLVGSLTSRS